MQDSTDDRYHRATLALAKELAEAVRQRDEARQVVDELHNQVGALTRACVELAADRDAALAGLPEPCAEMVPSGPEDMTPCDSPSVPGTNRCPTHTPEAPWVTSLRAQLDAARRIAEVEGLRRRGEALTRACVELARQRDAALAGRPVSALDDGRRLVRIEGGDREAMAEVLVEAFVDGDPETCQTIVDKLGEQSEH